MKQKQKKASKGRLRLPKIDTERALQLASVALKVFENRAQLKTVSEEVIAFFRMVRAWRRGKFTRVPSETIVGALTAILSQPTPLAVLTVIGALRGDIKKFQEWEQENLPWYGRLKNKLESYVVRRTAKQKLRKLVPRLRTRKKV